MTGVLDLGLDLNVWPWIWLSVAVVFALIELTVLAGSFVLLPFAVTAFLSSLLGFYGVNIEVQWLVFLVGGALLFAAFYRWSRRFATDNPKPPGVGADRMVGLDGAVTVTIRPDDVDRRGRVSVNGELWGALTDTAHTLVEGTTVRVVAVRGTRLIVEASPLG